MTTETAENGAGAVPLQSTSFERFAGVCAVLTGIAGFLYAAVSFILLLVSLQNDLLNGLFLMLGGLFPIATLVAVYGRLRETDAAFALFALLLGIAGAFGSAVHGGYDLAMAINPPLSVLEDIPNPIDPRGLLAFGVAGAGLFFVGWLIVRGGQFPKGLGYLAYLSAVLLVVLYLGRLIFFDVTNPMVLVPALLNGFLVNPALYIWLGLVLLRGRSS